jgi:hypothetical protein
MVLSLIVKYCSPSVVVEYEVADAEATIGMLAVEAALEVSIVHPVMFTYSVAFKRTVNPPVARMYKSSKLT